MLALKWDKKLKINKWYILKLLKGIISIEKKKIVLFAHTNIKAGDTRKQATHLLMCKWWAVRSGQSVSQEWAVRSGQSGLGSQSGVGSQEWAASQEWAVRSGIKYFVQNVKQEKVFWRQTDYTTPRSLNWRSSCVACACARVHAYTLSGTYIVFSEAWLIEEDPSWILVSSDFKISELSCCVTHSVLF